MKQPRRSISFLALVTITGVSLVAFFSNAIAQGRWSSDGAVTNRSYVLTSATGTWGAAQDQAVADAAGTLIFGHAASGIGAASSSNPNFLRLVTRTGAFGPSGLDQMVQWVEPANELPAGEDLTEEAVTPGDETFINLQWNMTAIDASGAWGLGYDGNGVRVAVIDGGICKDHLDLKDNIDVAASRSFVTGFNFYDDTGGPTAFRHACHVAGIIAAEDNGVGTIGVAPKATIIALKALHGGSGSFANVIQAILYASDPITQGGAGADIINMSIGALFARGGGNTGGGPLVAALAKAVNYATAHNVLVVCSAGNAAVDLDHSVNAIQVPAQSGSALGISATGPVGYAVGWPNGATNFRRPASYTNYGSSAIWVAAPGGDNVYVPVGQVCSIPRVPAASVTTSCWVFDLIISPGAGTGFYFFADGTSMAAPHVAGVAALIKQKYPGILVGDLKTQLIQTADDEGAIGTDPFYGHGFINAHRAVTEPLGASSANSTITMAAAAPALELAVSRGLATNGTSFSFTLPTAGKARLEMFDIAGRSVAVIFNGAAPAGRTTVSWDGRGANGEQLRRGAYFVRISSGGVKAARKLVLVSN